MAILLPGSLLPFLQKLKKEGDTFGRRNIAFRRDYKKGIYNDYVLTSVFGYFATPYHECLQSYHDINGRVFTFYHQSRQ